MAQNFSLVLCFRKVVGSVDHMEFFVGDLRVVGVFLVVQHGSKMVLMLFVVGQNPKVVFVVVGELLRCVGCFGGRKLRGKSY